MEDVHSGTQGRKKKVVYQQVGIQCRHCAGFPTRQRGRGAVYYPYKLQGRFLFNRVQIPGIELSLCKKLILLHRYISSMSKHGNHPFMRIMPMYPSFDEATAAKFTGNEAYR